MCSANVHQHLHCALKGLLFNKKRTRMQGVQQRRPCITNGQENLSESVTIFTKKSKWDVGEIHGGRGWWWRGETLFVSELTETSYSKTKQTKGTNNLSFSEPGTPNIRCDTGKVDGYHQSPSSQACSSSQFCSLYALLPLRRPSPCGNRSLAGHWLANVYMILTTCGDPREQNTTLLGSGSMSIPPKDSGLSFCLV